MRENTRCEVDEPISTPTERMTISSSPSSVRPLLEKKIRPPSASSVIYRLNLAEQNAWIKLQAKHGHEQQPDHRGGGRGDARCQPQGAAPTEEKRREYI